MKCKDCPLRLPCTSGYFEDNWCVAVCSLCKCVEVVLGGIYVFKCEKRVYNAAAIEDDTGLLLVDFDCDGVPIRSCLRCTEHLFIKNIGDSVPIRYLDEEQEEKKAKEAKPVYQLNDGLRPKD